MVLHGQWVEDYGPTIQYQAFLGVGLNQSLFLNDIEKTHFQMHRLYTTDKKALNHVLMNTAIYQKPEAARFNISQILGDGVLVVEGEKHKQQVRQFIFRVCCPFDSRSQRKIMVAF